ncbi:MAG: hypothetical protein AAFU61_16870, partial [Pseudomonadota bacterium]
EVLSYSAEGLRGDPVETTYAPIPSIAPVPEGIESFTLNILAPEGFLFQALSRDGAPTSLRFSFVWEFDEAAGGPVPDITPGPLRSRDVTLGLLDGSGGIRTTSSPVEIDIARPVPGGDLEITELRSTALFDVLDEVTTFRGVSLTGRFTRAALGNEAWPLLTPLVPTEAAFFPSARVGDLGGPALSLVADPDWAPTTVPAPAGIALLTTALAGLALFRRRA